MTAGPERPASDVVTVSVVSHGQYELVERLLGDLDTHCRDTIRVVLTHNVPEDGSASPERYRFPVRSVRNAAPKGFGANHNAAFDLCDTGYFCVLNPDIRLEGDPFPALRASLADPGAGVAAPRIVNPGGGIEDSARRFPTVASIARKVLGRATASGYEARTEPFSPDWVAGMFMLFRAEHFARVRGFDDRFFLYYEDVDICARLWCAGLHPVVNPSARAIHDARRTSHRNLRYLRWHLASMLRFLLLSPRVPARLRAEDGRG